MCENEERVAGVYLVGMGGEIYEGGGVESAELAILLGLEDRGSGSKEHHCRSGKCQTIVQTDIESQTSVSCSLPPSLPPSLLPSLPALPSPSGWVWREERERGRPHGEV
jgi:hypothetical protein